jgi:membrane protein
MPRRALVLPARRRLERRTTPIPAAADAGRPQATAIAGPDRPEPTPADVPAAIPAAQQAEFAAAVLAGTVAATPPAERPRSGLVRRTVSRAWHDRLLGLSAEAAFWSLLSLPPLFLALLGSLGYFSAALGPDTVNDIEQHLLAAFSRAFSPSVVDQVIQPMVSDLLRRGRADVISIGFLISLWAGSSATSTFVNTVTIAYGMRELRGAVRSRLVALGLFVLTMIVGVVLLPMLVLGPSVLVELAPSAARGDATRLLNAVYWPVVAGILLAGLITFYHLAVPKRLPWSRGVPGALLAAAVFLLGGSALRGYISFVVGQGLSYGALAAPIAALLFFFVLALAVLLGAELNATIEQMWPSPPTRRQRRRASAAAAAATAEPPAD